MAEIKLIYNYDTHNQFHHKTLSQTESLDMFINRKSMSICRKVASKIHLGFLILEKNGHG